MLIKYLNVLGRKVVLDEYGSPKVVNDGVTIVKAIELPEWRTLVLLLSERFESSSYSTIAFQVLAKALIGLEPDKEMVFLMIQFQKFIAGFMSLRIELPGTQLHRSLEAKKKMVKLILKIIQVGKKLMVAYDLMVISESMKVVDNLANEVQLHRALEAKKNMARFMDDVLENPQLPHHCNPPPFIYPNCLSGTTRLRWGIKEFAEGVPANHLHRKSEYVLLTMVFAKMDFKSFMMEGINDEFYSEPEGGVGDDEGSSSSTRSVNNEAPVIDVEPITSVPPSQFFENTGDSDDASSDKDEVILVDSDVTDKAKNQNVGKYSKVTGKRKQIAESSRRKIRQKD
nr:3-epi-6-deoxocathasterone 23-monooxygenase [Tanacetum cinerariifolium]